MWLTWMALAGAAEPPEGFDVVFRALSNRHAQPCDVVEALTPNPVASLRYAVDHVPMPPWAGMRAAECLARGHAEEVQADLERWVSDPELRGLGRQTLALLPDLPVPVAVAVGRKALEGPEAVAAKERLLADERPEVRAVVVAP